MQPGVTIWQILQWKFFLASFFLNCFFEFFLSLSLFFLPFCMAAKPPVSFKLFVGNLNFNKTVAELKTGLSELFAKNDIAVVGVRVGLSR